MRKGLLFTVMLAVSVALVSCGGKKMTWEPAVEQSTFEEIDQSLPGLREALMNLNETINKRITTTRYKEEALAQLASVSAFADILQFYYLPVLNARAHIDRAYREIDYGMYTDASDDIKKGIDNLNKASLKSTDNTKAGFDEVKRGLMEVDRISDDTAQAHMVRLANAAKKLNLLIEKIKPVVVKTEEGESLINGQL
jgi:hypothetical protein